MTILRPCILIAILPMWGCASLQDFSNNNYYRVLSYTSSICTGNAPILDGDYTSGWRQGYYDLISGRRCKPPVVPPHQYWCGKYDCPAGKKKIEQWYCGYQNGMMAAEKRRGACSTEIHPRLEYGPYDFTHAAYMQDLPSTSMLETAPVFEAPPISDLEMLPSSSRKMEVPVLKLHDESTLQDVPPAIPTMPQIPPARLNAKQPSQPKNPLPFPKKPSGTKIPHPGS